MCTDHLCAIVRAVTVDEGSAMALHFWYQLAQLCKGVYAYVDDVLESIGVDFLANIPISSLLAFSHPPPCTADQMKRIMMKRSDSFDGCIQYCGRM